MLYLGLQMEISLYKQHLQVRTLLNVLTHITTDDINEPRSSILPT